MNSDLKLPSSSPQVLIIGAGFAGLRCALELAPHSNIRITLIDKHNYQQFQPLLYQVAASLLSPGNAAFALRDVLRSYLNVDVQMDEITSIDLSQRTAHALSGRSFSADFLVLAPGSKVNFFGVPGAEQYTLPLYSLTDAERLRSRILSTFEAADSSPQSAKGQLNLVVVGGGPTGVEMAGALSDMLQDVFQREFRHADANRAKVILIERSPSLLGAFSPASQAYAYAALVKREVEVRVSAVVSEVGEDYVRLADGVRIESTLVIWAAGIRAVEIPMQPEPPRKPNGRVEVSADLTLKDFPNVYVAGDLANASDGEGEPLPQLAAVAQQAGRHCAENILSVLNGGHTEPFAYSDKGILAMIGRNSAVAELGPVHHEVTGPIAYAIWLGVHAMLLTVTRARLETILEWAWTYFVGPRPSQLIDVDREQPGLIEK
jgi:NADH dehydrogenase